MVKVNEIKESGEPISSCFCDNPRDKDGSENYMSVYVHDCLVANNWTPQKLYEFWGVQYRVFCFTAEYLRSKGERLWRAPMGAIPGHSGCKRIDDSKRSVGQKRELARKASLVKLDYGS